MTKSKSFISTPNGRGGCVVLQKPQTGLGDHRVSASGTFPKSGRNDKLWPKPLQSGGQSPTSCSKA
jgi:hypothetical protein